MTLISAILPARMARQLTCLGAFFPIPHHRNAHSQTSRRPCEGRSAIGPFRPSRQPWRPLPFEQAQMPRGQPWRGDICRTGRHSGHSGHSWPFDQPDPDLHTTQTYLVDFFNLTIARDTGIPLSTGHLGELRTHHRARHGRDGQGRGIANRCLCSEGPERGRGRVSQEGADAGESE